uniref:Uncharacterized protein n=1 Tax=Romanomermis culicivorax TaxID=13658 RepID=A0A915K9U6_ROMCU
MIKALFAQTLAKMTKKRKTPGAGINQIAKKPGSSNDVYEFHSSDSESCTAELVEQTSGVAYSVPSPANKNKSLKTLLAEFYQLKEINLLKVKQASIVTDDFSEISLDEAHDPSENQEKVSPSSKHASPNSTSRKVSPRDQNLKDPSSLPPEASYLTTTPCSRKERLLGLRKVKKTIDFELEASESNPEMARKDSNEKETLEKTVSFSRLTSQLSSPPRRSSMIELSNVNRPCSIGGVLTPSTSPKVPPLKLFLSNSCRASLTTPNTSGTPPLNTSFVAEDEDCSSYFSRASQDNVEGSQRVTRSQVRLHGSEEPSPLTFNQQPPPTPTLARKRKVKQSAANNKIIEPVNQVARYFKPTLAHNIAVIASKNVYEAQYELRKMIEKKWREDKKLDSAIEYTKPKGYDKFMISRKERILQGFKERAVELSTFPSTLRDLVEKQKEVRGEMKNRHSMERNRLIIACETEALRVSNRIQRGTIDPPISAMRIIRDSEIYNSVQLEKASYSENGFNGPVSVEKYSEISSFNDLLTRFTRCKNQMIGRQRLESGCLLASQTAEFAHELKIRENKTLSEYFQPDERFPSVEVVVDFDLLPSELLQNKKIYDQRLFRTHDSIFRLKYIQFAKDSPFNTKL